MRRTRAQSKKHDLLQALMDNTPDHIYFKDRDSRFTMISHALASSFGLADASEAVGKTDFDYFTADHAQPAHEGERTIMATGMPIVDLEEKETWPDGHENWVSTTKLPRYDRTGNVLGTFGISRDITARVVAQQDLKEAYRALEEASARAELMAARADSANVAKSAFLANMSHEIRTPLNGVIGMTSLLLDTELEENQRRFAETIRASGEALLALLNDILDFSKIEAGRLELETLDFDLRVLLDDFATMLAQRASDKGLEFICAAAPDIPAHLSGDPGRLRQVLLNLAGNALKFTDRGEVAVRARLVSETDGDVVVRFSVNDTGIGISTDQAEHLFERFTQADSSTTRRFGGTGLGLAISKQLAELMGGEIGIVNNDGPGSEFWFTTRLTKQTERERLVVPTAPIKGVHILVVDDNATNREVLIAQLGAWGVRCEATSDGPSALLALARASDADDAFEAAIVDMQMPGMDGVHLARAIKADKALASTRLVLMTSIGERGDARQMQEAGFAAYLIKPARQSDLFDSLSAVLAGTTLTRPARPIITRHTIREMNRSAIRVLLAEDNVTNQQVALGILDKLGLSADAVANGREAVEALERSRYDLVLMDVQMPEMDGFEATRHIRDPRSGAQNHAVPIIAMTAHAMQGDRERCLEAGMNDYVTKPVSPQLLAEALDRWLPREANAAMAHVAAGASANDAGAIARSATDDAPKPVFDRAGMLARVMGDEDLARTVVAGFLEDLPKQVEALKAQLEAGDTPAVIRQVHTLKGASATVGAQALQAVAVETELAAQAGDLEAVMARVPDLESEFARLRVAMGAAPGAEHPAPGAGT